MVVKFGMFILKQLIIIAVLINVIKPVILAMPGNDYVTGVAILLGPILRGISRNYDGTKKLNFGLVMKWNKSGKNLQGK